MRADDLSTDSSTVRHKVGDFLKKDGSRVALAIDGRDGLTKLFVCELNMPNRDGLSMAEKIRSEQGNSTVSIIMLTTENPPIMKERGQAAGTKGWIVKPKDDAVLATFKKLAG